MKIDDKVIDSIIQNKDYENDFSLEIENKTFKLQNVLITESSTPLRKPSQRGGVYFSDMSSFKIKTLVDDNSIISFLSKVMLGPNTEFQNLKIKTKTMVDGSMKNIVLFTNITNTVQNSKGVELNMTIVGTSEN